MKKAILIIWFIFLFSGIALAVDTTDINHLTEAAQSGDLESVNTLGQMYLYGEGVEQDIIKGRQLLQQAAEKGNAEAQFILGESYYDETLDNVRCGLPDKSEKALYWLLQAFDNGRPDAGFYIGDIYFKGGNSEDDYEKARQFFDAAAQAGNRDAKSSLDRFDDDVADKAKLNNLRQQANNGDVLAAKQLIQAYFVGQVVFPDQGEYIKWLQKAAELGDVDSQRMLANGYESGVIGLPVDYKQALYWRKTVAALGGQRDQLRLLMIQLKGEFGVIPNPEEAAQKIIAMAEEGFIDAQIQLIKMYLAGSGVVQNYQQAVKWLIQLAESENMDLAADKLGDLYLNGTGIAQNYELAMQWYIKASDDSNRNKRFKSDYKLAEMYIQGLGDVQNYDKAMNLYLKAAKDTDAEISLKSQARLWEIYYYHLLEGQDDVKAFELAEELANKGRPEGYYGLALAYYEGRPVAVNNIKALIWLKKLFEAQDVSLKIIDKANSLVSLVLDRVTDKEKKAAEWDASLTIDKFPEFNYEALVNKAKQNSSASQLELAKRYYEGAGVEQNYKESMDWCTKAAENNNTEAQYLLGKLYSEGIATQINSNNCIYWTLKAAEAGLPEAQYALSNYYRFGYGNTVDLKESFKWMLKAAEEDFLSAQDKVAKMYLHGIGTAADHVKAYVWLAKVYENLKKSGKNFSYAGSALEIYFPANMTEKELNDALEILESNYSNTNWRSMLWRVLS